MSAPSRQTAFSPMRYRLFTLGPDPVFSTSVTVNVSNEIEILLEIFVDSSSLLSQFPSKSFREVQECNMYNMGRYTTDLNRCHRFVREYL